MGDHATCCEMMALALRANGDHGIRRVPVIDGTRLTSAIAYRMKEGKQRMALLLKSCPWCGTSLNNNAADAPTAEVSDG